MGMNPITPGLRRINYDARSAAKVQIVVQPGDVLEVSDDVADQLLRSSPQFKDAATPVTTGTPAAGEAPAVDEAPVADDATVEQSAKRRTSRKA